MPVLDPGRKCLAWLLNVVVQGTNPNVEKWLTCVHEIGIPVKHIRSTQQGRSAGINRGLEQVDTRFVTITDDDCFVEENWLVNMADHLRQRPDAFITGRVEAAGDEVAIVVTSLYPSEQNRPRLKFDSMSGENMYYCHTACLIQQAALVNLCQLHGRKGHAQCVLAQCITGLHRIMDIGLNLRFDTHEDDYTVFKDKCFIPWENASSVHRSSVGARKDRLPGIWPCINDQTITIPFNPLLAGNELGDTEQMAYDGFIYWFERIY